jgi:hypothetical protein
MKLIARARHIADFKHNGLRSIYGAHLVVEDSVAAGNPRTYCGLNAAAAADAWAEAPLGMPLCHLCKEMARRRDGIVI